MDTETEKMDYLKSYLHSVIKIKYNLKEISEKRKNSCFQEEKGYCNFICFAIFRLKKLLLKKKIYISAFLKDYKLYIKKP